jgi:hypothetical protein
VLIIPKTALHKKIETDDAFAKRFYRALAIFMADRLRDTLNPGENTRPAPDPERLDKILGYLRAM